MTDTTIPIPAWATVDDLRHRFLHLETKRAEIIEEQDAIKAQLRALGPGKHAVGNGTITVTPQRRFNVDQAAEVLAGLSPDLLAACQVTRVDAAAAKQKLSPALYEQCMRPSGPDKVSVS